MKKLHVLFSTLIVVAGMMMIGMAFLLSRPATSTLVEAKVVAPSAPVVIEPVVAAAIQVDTVAVPAIAAIDLNTRDAIISSEDELASVEMNDVTFESALASVRRDDLMGGDETPLAMELVLPPAAPAPAAPQSVGAAPSEWFHVHHFVWHRIRWGETLSGIAVHTHTTVRRLQVLNGIRCANFIIAGRWILVPA